MDATEFNKLKLLQEQTESLAKTGTWELDLVEQNIVWTDGVFRMLGYKPQEFEVTFEKAIEIIHPEDRKKSTDLLDEVLKNHIDYFIEKRLISKNGNILYIRSKANVFKDKKGKPVKLIGVFQDITDFVTAENLLKEQNSLTRDIIKNLPSALFLFNSEEKNLLWNKKLENISEYDPDEVEAIKISEYFEGTERDKAKYHIQEAFKMGYTEGELWVTTKSKNTVPIFFTASTIEYQGEPCILGTAADISEMLSLLNELELLIGNTDEAFMYVDQALKVVSYNKQMQTQYEFLFDGRLEKGIKLDSLAKTNQKEELEDILRQVWKKQEVKTTLSLSRDNKKKYYLIKFKPILSEKDEVQGVFLTSVDVTETHIANRELKKSQQKLQQVLDSSLDTLCTIDENGIFQMVSRSSEELWGYKPKELEGQNFMDFVFEEDREITEMMARQIKKGKQYRNFDNRYIHKNGSIVPVVWSAYWDQEQNLMHCVARDATDKLVAEEQLKFSERRFKSLVQEGGDLIAILDLVANYKYVSPTSTAILGIEPTQFLGKNAFDFIHPEDKDWVFSEFGKLENEKHLDLPPFRFKNKEGEWRWLESHISNLLHEPSVQGIVANSRDVTEMMELQQMVENATKLAKVGGWEINQLTGEHYWSRITKEIHEVSEDFNPDLDEAINFYHPNWQEKVSKAVEKAVENGESFDFEAIIITQKGNEKWVRAIGNAEMRDGQCVRIYGSFQDIHDRKVVEERLKSISNNIPGVLFQFRLHQDGSDTVDLVSKRAEEIFGVSAVDWIADPSVIWANIEKGGDLDYVMESIDHSAKQMSRWEASWRYIMPDGSVRYHQGIGNPEKKSDGSIVWDSIIIDVTDKKEAEIEAKRAKAELEKHAKELEISNAELEQFAYVASHDLQEPLRMITGFLTQLDKKYGGQLDKKANQYIEFAVDGAKRMRQIILDLLDYSKAGKTEVELTEVDINEVVQEVCLLHRKQIEELNANVEFKGLPKIFGHPSPMIQVFSNLISNALKYSSPDRPPKIIIKATELKNEWKFSVKDNGIGIEKSYYDKIFNIFQRLHNRNEYSGTGMGLAIVKKIVENMNGRIWLNSTENQGSTFYFTIPKQRN